MTTHEQKQFPSLHSNVETNPPYRPGADEAKKCYKLHNTLQSKICIALN